MKIPKCQEPAFVEFLEIQRAVTGRSVIISACSVCGEVLRVREYPADTRAGISHGYCLGCENQVRRENGMKEREGAHAAS